MLTLTAGKLIPGDEKPVDHPSHFRIRARAWAPPEIGKPKLLEVIANGKVIRSAPAEVDFDLLLNRGQWIAARVTCENGAVAHTSPIYFNFAGMGFGDASQMAAIAAKRIERLDFIESRIQTRGLAKEYGPEEQALRSRIAEARAIYQKLEKK